MSARAFTAHETGSAGYWPLAAAGGGPVAASVRHLIELNHFFPSGEGRWPDALTAETRRHLSGCFASIEIALVMAARASPTGAALSALELPLVWQSVRQQPQLLAPALMAHMRLRAAVSLLAREATRASGDAAAAVADGSSWLIDDADRQVAEAASALALAEARWTAQASEDAPMRPDLPAEYFAELVWTGAAVIGTALHRAGLSSLAGAMTTMADAAQAVLGRHDEEQGAFARATLLARILRGDDRQAQLLGQALGERRYLLFAAIAGELTDLGLDAVLDTLVHGSDRQLAALCHALGGAASDYRHLLIDLRAVRGARDDVSLVRLADDYDALTDADAAEEMDALRRPAALRTKLSLIAPVDAG